jgi:transcription initiation factor IIF auxiliary subunit
MNLFSQNIFLSNDSHKIGYDRYEWKVFVRADTKVLNTIAYVEYTLHKTFPNRVRRIYERQQNFALTAIGWGEFDILARVVFDNGGMIFLTYRLRLSGNKEFRGDVNIANSARYLGSSSGKWRIFLTAPKYSIDRIKSVDYFLHPSFPNPVRRISTKENGFMLTSGGWGSFAIEINVHFEDGEVKYFKHWLRFPPSQN